MKLLPALALGMALGCATTRTSVSHSTLPNLSDTPAPAIARDVYEVNIPDAPTDGGLNLATPMQGSLLTAMNAGQPAPRAGVLFNAEALAFVESEFRGQQQLCVIQRRADLGRMAARAVADLEHYQAAYQAREQEHRIILTGRDDEITRLYGLVAQPSSPPWTTYLVWFGGGVLLGAAAVGVSYIATH